MLATQGNTYRLVRAVILHCDTERHISIRAYNTERQVSIRDEPCQREWQLDEAARAPTKRFAPQIAPLTRRLKHQAEA